MAKRRSRRRNPKRKKKMDSTTRNLLFAGGAVALYLVFTGQLTLPGIGQVALVQQ